MDYHTVHGVGDRKVGEGWKQRYRCTCGAEFRSQDDGNVHAMDANATARRQERERDRDQARELLGEEGE